MEMKAATFASLLECEILIEETRRAHRELSDIAILGGGPQHALHNIWGK
jgi:hypothetical protein